MGLENLPGLVLQIALQKVDRLQQQHSASHLHPTGWAMTAQTYSH